jgi:hypothetical protein
LIYADGELINGDDMALARRHMIGEEEIKRMPVTCLVDTGSYMLAINETIREQLQLMKSPCLGTSLWKTWMFLSTPQRHELIVNPGHPYFAQMKMK